MKREEFYFDSRDGLNKIHAVRYTPDDGQVKCVLQIVHGMAEYIERYEEFARFLTDKGFVVTGDDHSATENPCLPEGITVISVSRILPRWWCVMCTDSRK